MQQFGRHRKAVKAALESVTSKHNIACYYLSSCTNPHYCRVPDHACKGKGEGAVPNAGHRRGAHLPVVGLQPVGG